MKKMFIITGAIAVVALIIFTLFNNRAEMQQTAGNRRAVAYPVSVVTVARQQFDEQIAQVGLINAKSDVAVVSELQGKTTAVMVQEGSYVAAGSPIAKIDDVLPEANYLAARSDYEKAQKDWERNQTLQKDGLISDSQLESFRQTFISAQSKYVTAERQYHNSTITSPISGIITSLSVDRGTMVNQGMTVANVVDISQLKVKLNVGEQDAFKLKVGDRAIIETDVYPGIKFYGRVENISAKGDDAHTYPVKIVIPNNKQHPLKSGMFGRVAFNLGNQVALTIPRDALLGSIQNAQVYVVADGKAKLRDIQVGSEVGTNIIVLKGLQEGETVVISGQVNLKDNAGVVVSDNSNNQNAGTNPNWSGNKGARQKGFRKPNKN